MTQESNRTTPRLLGLRTLKGALQRLSVTMLLMLLTTATAWAFKTETPTNYTVSLVNNNSSWRISDGTQATAEWDATKQIVSTTVYYLWKANERHNLANGMTIETNADVETSSVTSVGIHTTASTTFTFRAPNSIAITNVVFMNGGSTVNGTNSASGSTYTVTLAANTTFTGFNVTFGYISGKCGTSATWTLSKQNGQYTALTISGSGAMTNEYNHETVDGLWRTNAPWDWRDLKSVTIENSITSIGQYTFVGCQELSSLTIGTGVTTIGVNAFDHCDKLTQVTLPASVTTLNDAAFKNCTSLQRINIQHNGAVTLGNNVFDGALQYIVFPNPTAALANTTGNWSGLASKLRVEFGGYLFSVTNEGGADAYAITSETDLRNLASAINNGSTDIANGKTFRQTGNITLSSTNFTPIGTSTQRHFSGGTYDGGGYTISGLHISHLDDINFYGLFGYVKNGTVKNVRLVSPSGNVGNVSSSTYYGALIGRAVGSGGASTTVQNCVVISPNIEGSGSNCDKGAIIGQQDNATLKNLYYYEGNLNNAIGIVGGGGSGTNVGRARKVTIGSGISSVTPAINSTATSLDNGFVYDNKIYYREGLELTLANNLSGKTGYHAIYKASYNNGSKTLDGNTYTVNSTDRDVTLTAELENNTYTVHFDNQNATTAGTTEVTATYDAAMPAITVPTRTGYTFGGYYTAINGDGTQYYKADGTSARNWDITAATTLYAKWTPVTYTITYYLNGGTLETDKNSYTIESPDITLDTPTRTGCTFLGWYDNSGLTGNAVKTIAHGSTGDKQFWAKWTLTNYTITYNLNGGSLETDKNSYTIESADITLDEPTREGYTFDGWYTNAGLTGNAVTTIAHGSTENKEFWAKWTLTTYTITYNLNGGTLETNKNTYTIESPDIFLDEPTRAGYTFDGWYDNAGLTGTAVKTIAHGSTGDKQFWAKWLLPYIDANGKTQICSNFTVLTNSTNIYGLNGGWYVVTENVSYSSAFQCVSGDIHLILCDGAKMTVESNNYSAVYIGSGSLTIYVQSTGSSMGQLVATATNDKGIFASRSITICGGNITATANGNYAGIRAWDGITIHSGQVSASGGNYGISANNNITLGLRNATDRIYASSYYANGTVKIADGQRLYNGSEIISGTVYGRNEDDLIDHLDKVNGKVLMGVDVLEDAATNDVAALATRLGGKRTNIVLNGRKLWKDGDWNTLCLPFDLGDPDAEKDHWFDGTLLEGATVKELDITGTYGGKQTGLDGTTLYLYFKDADRIEAGVPYIVMWPETSPNFVENPVFQGVTIENGLNNVTFTGGAFKGTYAWQQYTEENESILLLGTQNTLYWPKPDGNTYPSIGAFRAYFELADGQEAREFVLNFDGDYTTRIISTTNLTNFTNSAGAWFDLSGRKLDTKPTKKGVYIYKGKKRVIK